MSRLSQQLTPCKATSADPCLTSRGSYLNTHLLRPELPAVSPGGLLHLPLRLRVFHLPSLPPVGRLLCVMRWQTRLLLVSSALVG